MQSVFLIFPHQLFKDVSILKNEDLVYLIEEDLYFNQYKFHKQKLILHRSSMQFYMSYLQNQEITVTYIEASNELCKTNKLIQHLANQQINSISFYDLCDNWLEKRIVETCNATNILYTEFTTPLFINSKQDLVAYFGTKQKYFQTDFYIQQRKKLKILVDENDKPIGGKWSFDAENRLKYPKTKVAPKTVFPSQNQWYQEAVTYIEANYSNNYGEISTSIIYPSTHQESEIWLSQFLEQRFKEFGEYEDAIVEDESFLHHSVLTPMLNIGLLLPMQIVHAAINYANTNQIPLNCVEGFIRQIIGWRELIRGVYVYKGNQERTLNYWKFTNQIPASFYTGTTGIVPIDVTLKKLLKSGYNHHIERLMILGNFMLLCEFNPNAVYQWFMEMYIDAYDWVMVPNVYGMSQFADGGLMATKPYISGSSYVLKMSNYKKENWSAIWDALFWHFMNKQRNFFLSNPRLGMLIKTYDKMNEIKKNEMHNLATKFLNSFQKG